MVEFVARHTGGARETVTVVIWRLTCAGMAVGAAGVVKEAWEEWEYGWKALAKALAVAVAVIGLIAVGIVWLKAPEMLAIRPPAAVRYPSAMAYRLEPPPTFYILGIIIIVVGWLVFYSGIVWRGDPATLNLHRVSEGVGGLAVVALCLHNAALDVGGFGSLLAWFAQVPHLSLSPVVWLSLGALVLLTIISGLRLVVGLQGPFLFWRKTMLVAQKLAWLGFGAGLWLWGAFVPPSWSVALSDVFFLGFVPGVNFALLALYLFAVASGGAAIAVLLFGGRIDPFDTYGGGAPRRPVPPR